jgi:ADP-ribose pyrophosphatase YjhB (NUDIX family)
VPERKPQDTESAVGARFAPLAPAASSALTDPLAPAASSALTDPLAPAASSALTDPLAPAADRPDDRFRHEVLAVVLRVRGKALEVLLWQRAAPPFEGLWSLPGGPLAASERLGTSAGRHLAAKVDLTVIAHLEQLETRSDPERDPRGRVLATAYLALVSADVEPRIPADTAWHPLRDLPPTAFDHGSIVGSARERLRAKLSYTNIGFALVPETFTIAQLRDIYAAALGHPVSATNLQRILTRRGVIVPTAAAARPTALGGRPATLYRFAAQTLVVTNPFAAFRPPTLVTQPGRPDIHQIPSLPTDVS